MTTERQPTRTHAATLILVPTELERRRLLDLGGFPERAARVELCGFGPIAAAARTAQILAGEPPARVLLIGICGAYDAAQHPVASALEFDEVAVEGIGVGEGANLIPPPRLGFPQWPGAEGQRAIFDRLPLAATRAAGEPRLLLTTCAASADAAQAEQRRARMPSAVAEDMEGFAVALACALAGVPLRIVRGVSNEVGDRRPENWRIPGALSAARELALELVNEPSDWSRGATTP